MRSRPSWACERGFTLIEVLVALAIVAIGMAAVLSTLTSSASTVIYLRDKTLANWVALNHIAEQRLLPQMPQLGKSDGDVDYAGQKWRWHQEVVETSVKGMFRIDVRVRPADSKADDERGWYVTLSGVTGDALAPPRGDMPMWGTGTGTGAPVPGNGLNNNGLNNGLNNNGLNNGLNNGQNNGLNGNGPTGPPVRR
jgi:type II secretion system protein I